MLPEDGPTGQPIDCFLSGCQQIRSDSLDLKHIMLSFRIICRVLSPFSSPLWRRSAGVPAVVGAPLSSAMYRACNLWHVGERLLCLAPLGRLERLNATTSTGSLQRAPGPSSFHMTRDGGRQRDSYDSHRLGPLSLRPYTAPEF